MILGVGLFNKATKVPIIFLILKSLSIWLQSEAKVFQPVPGSTIVSAHLIIYTVPTALQALREFITTMA